MDSITAIMNNPNQTPSWRNSKRVDQSSSGSSFQATATPFIPRLAVTPNPGSFYQPTPQITHCGPEQPPSPYYPLESATFMPPDTPAGSALNSPGLGRPEEGVDYQVSTYPKIQAVTYLDCLHVSLSVSRWLSKRQ